ncbi:MAG: MCE family protein [Desulfobacteraceae bacterium]|nr:MAG: MCE family protein [Desulfobacteraceae bacterium]
MKETRKTLIGGFVVGALTLGIAGILVFGSGDVLKKGYQYVLFFEGSVKGLNVGAPVLFKGVPIGMVTDISIKANMTDGTIHIPVYIEIEPTRFEVVGHNDLGPAQSMQSLIDKGLRASLEIQSIVTGKFIIHLDFHPDTPIRLQGKEKRYTEVPTIKTGLSKWSQKLDEMNFQELVDRLTSMVAGVDAIISSPEAQSLLPAVHQTVEDVREFVNQADNQVTQFGTDLRTLVRNVNTRTAALEERIGRTLAEFEAFAQNANTRVDPLVKDFQQLARNLDDQVEPLLEDIRGTAKSIQGGIETAEPALENASRFIAHDSPVVLEMMQTLKELSAAARSIRVWAEYLERHPEALLQGKGAYRR